MMWRNLRIAILLFVLATVAQQAWLRENDVKWGDNLYVALHPVNADGSAAVSRYLETLAPQQFEAITEYFAAEGRRHGLALYHPFEIRLGDQVRQIPPLPPRAASALQAMAWSLHFRWWSWRHSPEMRVRPEIRLFLLYHDPARGGALAHSTALDKGRVGLVHVYGDPGYHAQNAVIIAHELLHTVGASDKYDRTTNQPLYPEGFAEPESVPRYPQQRAELMAGRVPVSESAAYIPQDLRHTVIGPATAREIGWPGLD